MLCFGTQQSAYMITCLRRTQTFIHIGEFGGIRIAKGESNGWGYGTAPQSEEEFFSRFEGQVRVLLQNPGIGAFCYTQLYDIEQEQNGLYTYERKPRVDPERLCQILSQPAAIESPK